MRMIIIDNKRVPAPPPPNLDWETALNPVIPSSSARDQMKYFDKWLEIKQEEQIEEANGGVPGEQDHFLEYSVGSSEAMAVEPPVDENGSHLNETARQPLFFPEYTPPAGTSNAFDKPTTSIVTGQEMDEEMYAEAAQWLQRSVADKSDDDAMAFLRSLLEDTSATAEDELSQYDGFAQPPPPKRMKTQEPPVASTSSLNQTSGPISLPFKFRRDVSNFKIRFACVEDLNFHLVGALKDRLQCKICGADFDTESFLKTHKGLCHRKSRKKVDLTCSSCRTHSCNVRLYLSHFASEKHRSLCPCSKQSLLQDKKN